MSVSSFHTSDFKPQQRIEAWSELIWSAIGRLNTQAESARDFDGLVEFGNVGGVSVCRAAIRTPHRVARTAELIRRDDRGVFKLVFQSKGSAIIEQCGKQLVLNPGEWSIYDASKPYVVVNPGEVEFLAMLVPRDQLPQINMDTARLTLLRSPATTGLGRLILAYVNVLLEESSCWGVSCERQVVDSVLELVQLAVTEQSRGGDRGATGAIFKDRIKSCITRHLRDPELSIEMLADMMHCSKRHLHKMFSEDSETISQFLWKERLERCREELLDPLQRDRSITQIAFSWGFNNAAHFSRCFKARYGASPSEYRGVGYQYA